MINTEASTLQALCVEVLDRKGQTPGTVYSGLRRVLAENDRQLWAMMSHEERKTIIGTWVFGLLYLAEKEGVDLYAEAQQRLYTAAANVAVNEVSPLTPTGVTEGTTDE